MVNKRLIHVRDLTVYITTLIQPSVQSVSMYYLILCSYMGEILPICCLFTQLILLHLDFNKNTLINASIRI